MPTEPPTSASSSRPAPPADTPPARRLLFGDSGRGRRVLATCVLLAGLMAYFGYAVPPRLVTFHRCIEDPGHWDGRPLSVALTRVLRTEPSGGDRPPLLVVRAGPTFGLVVPPPGTAPLTRGDTISVHGTFRSPDRLVAHDLFHHRLRSWKPRASLAGLIGVAAFLATRFRWDRGRRCLVERAASPATADGGGRA